MATVAIEITFTEEVLGSSPNTKEIYSEFIASKAPDAASVADEVEAVGADEVTEKGTTVFPRNDDGEPVIWDYQLKGFMKDACGALRRVPGTLSSKCKAYRRSSTARSSSRSAASPSSCPRAARSASASDR